MWYRLSLHIACLLLPLLLSGQKRDFIWYSGYGRNPNEVETYNIEFNFHENAMQITYPNLGLSLFNTNAVISTESGELRFFSNNCDIMEGPWQLVDGGEMLNEGYASKEFCTNLLGYPITDNAVFLPDPADTVNYYLFYLGYRYQYQPVYYGGTLRFAYAKINKDPDGVYRVIAKDEALLLDTLSGGGMKPIRHANGRDWWMIVPKFDSNRYYIYLFDPTGPHLAHTQTIGDVHSEEALFTQVAVAPDGGRYARYGNNVGLMVFDFDRCSGLLSNYRNGGAVRDFFSCNGNGMAISPNARYLYLSQCDSLFQYDLQASDLAASKLLLHTDSPLTDPERQLAWMQVAPDGKIYFWPGNGVSCVHVIHNPDEKGLASRPEIQAYCLNHFKNGFPNFPNYRLGPVDGSACDTLGLNNVPWAHWRWRSDTLDGLRLWFRDLSAYEPASWQWDFGDPASGAANSSIERHPQHRFSGPGEYTVCLRVSNAEGEDVFCRQVYVSGVDASSPWSAAGALRAMPNPGTGLFRIEGLQSPDARYEVFGADGRLLASGAFHTNTVDLSRLGAGLYLMRVQDNGSSQTLRLNIVR